MDANHGPLVNEYRVSAVIEHRLGRLGLLAKYSNFIYVFFPLDTFKNAWRKLTNSYTWVLGGVRVGLGGLGVQGSFVPGRFIKKH